MALLYNSSVVIAFSQRSLLIIEKNWEISLINIIMASPPRMAVSISDFLFT